MWVRNYKITMKSVCSRLLLSVMSFPLLFTHAYKYLLEVLSTWLLNCILVCIVQSVQIIHFVSEPEFASLATKLRHINWRRDGIQVTAQHVHLTTRQDRLV